MEEAGAYYTWVETRNRPHGRGGPFQVVQRDCGDYFELAHIGVFFPLKDGSPMIQSIVRDDSGHNVGLKVTWISREVGAIRLPPMVHRQPKNLPQDLILRNQLEEQLKRETHQIFDAIFQEACDRHGIVYGYVRQSPSTITVEDDIVFSP